MYNGIPHLLIPVVTDPKKAASALNWAVREMLQRYNDFAAHGVRDIKGFNKLMEEKGDEKGKMPQIVIIIDELADLMMAAPGEVEDAICRLAQMAACSRDAPDYCDTASLCGCHYGGNQGEYPFQTGVRCILRH